MRNVSIWELNEVISHDTPPIVRLFQYKGVKRTLNEFLSPVYVYRDGGFFRRDKNIPNLGMTFDLSIKGQVVLMGYGSLEQSENGQGAPLMVFGSFEQAVHWLIRNGYDFYGEESANWRRRKVKSVDFYAERKKYLDIAHQYEQSKKSVLIKPCVTVGEEVGVVDNSDLNQAIKSLNPTPPASRVLNDQGAPVKQKVKKPTFMENMMKFLRLFKK
ncbi:hypothetical protein selz4t1_51 [Salmonella phage selz]|uniref:Uncharacterized protein n=1 Tax=Salmonella phage SenALZ1 TaxID=2301647 RepID=A0A385IT02_9CAUD|nr:hypothetical protein HYP69_gp059 [Salmonella phage SenALZ1]UJQ69940.1 hypothetical protein selz4t1_51 [Salmonella phage selz]AXY86654.1 hypothetical protein SeLz1_59 [Salmonella phage SenALZ1]QZB89913.1 hypothetical protein selz232L_59 [Salmonella phage SenALZ1]QZB90058.1 hypothetical protein selz497L_59 [Salmonella phage SenALZ1]UJQ70115.1 hypothetical protein selz4t2_53 [Salmonella phage selz]